ncbi:molybdopterin molybdotransferase MoeA [Marinomonas epiphytica]
MSSLMPFAAALQHIKETASIKVETETIATQDALNRTLASNIVAGLDVPPWDNSAMDGYALALDDWQASKALPVSEYITAGSQPSHLEAGTCARIFTGAPIPIGADLVIMQENAQLTEQGVLFNQQPERSQNIRPQGQDIAKGQMILSQGKQLTPMDLGLLASIGVDQVEVYCPLKVAILTTGDELTPAGTPLADGQIYNSNGPMLAALVAQLGHQVEHQTHVKDEPEATMQALQELAKTSDIILSSGGVSVGEKDYVTQALEELGTVHLWKIAMKPGKPLMHASINGIPFLGLPGNPSSTLVTFHWFARTLLNYSAGRQTNDPKSYPVAAGFQRATAIKRDEFIRVSIDSQGQAQAHKQQSSGALLAACESDGYLHIKAGSEIKQGEEYDYYPFDTFK